MVEVDISALLENDERGNIRTFSGIDAVSESIRNLIFIAPEENILDPEGSPLNSFLQMDISEDTALFIKQIVESLILRSEDRIESGSLKVEVTPRKDQEVYDLYIRFIFAEKTGEITEVI